MVQLLLGASEDSQVGLGDSALGVRTCPGARLLRLLALDRRRLPKQADPLDDMAVNEDAEALRHRNCKSVGELGSNRVHFESCWHKHDDDTPTYIRLVQSHC